MDFSCDIGCDACSSAVHLSIHEGILDKILMPLKLMGSIPLVSAGKGFHFFSLY